MYVKRGAIVPGRSMAASGGRQQGPGSQRRVLRALAEQLRPRRPLITADPSESAARQQQPPQQQPVFRVVLTGGPCGGKSSSQQLLTAQLTEAGYAVLFVPEVPYLIITGGAAYPGLAPENAAKLQAFEHGIVKAQMALEDAFVGIARAGDRPAVLLCDRGLLDVAAYLPRERWLQLLGEMGHTEQQLAPRYDLVLHLVTTAHGLEPVFLEQAANNAARSEGPEAARALDDAVLESWSRWSETSESLEVVRLGNDDVVGGFDAKCQRAVDAVMDALHVQLHGRQ
eukprot:SAG22_NODE_270_length_13234_cov_13.248573_4_plen_284_part_00